MTKQTKRITVSVPVEEFEKITRVEGTNQNQLVNLLLKQYDYCPTPKDFLPDEWAIVEQAIHVSSITLKQRMKNMIVKESQRIIESGINIKPPKNVDTTLRNSAKSAEARINALVMEIMNNNDTAEVWYNKTFITNKAISDLAKKNKRENPSSIVPNKTVIKKYLELHHNIINEHHNKHNLEPNHNFRVHLEKKKLQNAEVNENA